MRNLLIILGSLLGCLLVMLILWAGWLFITPSTSAPTPTSSFSFVTPTSAAGSPVAAASPTQPVTVTTATPSPTAVPTITPTPIPIPTATPAPIFTPTPIIPFAVIDSPNGYVNIRSGPGVNYDPPLGTYQNGRTAQVLGKHTSTQGQLWWLITFPPGPYGQGWVFAGYTVAENVDNVPWVAAPPTPTRVVVTPTATPKPHAIINSRDGFLNVRPGPGWVYQPVLGAFTNDTVVDVLGKQLSSDGTLWWLVPFAGGPNGQGWIYANYTIAINVDNVPWVTAPPTPTLEATRTRTPTPTATVIPIVTWTISGRVTDAASNQPIGGANVLAKLGTDGTTRTAFTDNNGQFSIVAQARDEGNLELTFSADGYEAKTITMGAIRPRVYNFPSIQLVRTELPLVTWVIFGRVVETGTANPIANAQVEAILGDDGTRLDTLTNNNGEFSLNGQARDEGTLTVNITADGYQFFSLTSDQTASRIYNLSTVALVPLAGSCNYESVINLNQSVALARLATLNFTNVSTTSIPVGGNDNLLDLVLSQTPDPPPEGQSQRLNCQIPIQLGIGVRE